MEEVTAAQAAGLTGLSERTIRRRIAAGKLVARRVAPNRFAIAVGDLPLRHDLHALMGRLEQLERRVQALETPEQAPAGGTGGVPTRDKGANAGPVAGDAVAQLQDLLAQLQREMGRLAPVLGAVVSDDAARDSSTAHGSIGGRGGRLRPASRDAKHG